LRHPGAFDRMLQHQSQPSGVPACGFRPSTAHGWFCVIPEVFFPGSAVANIAIVINKLFLGRVLG